MGYSSLVKYKRLSPNHSGKRNHSVDRITPHCVVGQCSIESLGAIFADPDYECSSNYGIGYDGKVGLFVDEANRSWCSSSSANDNRAITIECASDAYAPYAFKTVVYNKLVELCVDICKRYKKTKLLWISDKTKALNYSPKSNEMILTVHRWFANKSCPGDWMYSRMGKLAEEVTKKLGSTPTPTPTPTKTYYVQIGAFGLKKNADNYAAKAKKAGFNTYIKKEGLLYKVQIGAFSNKKNAEALVTKAKKAGFNAIIK